MDACRSELSAGEFPAAAAAFSGLPPRTVLSLAQIPGGKVADGTPGQGSAFSRAWSRQLERVAEAPTKKLAMRVALSSVSAQTYDDTADTGAPQITDAGMGATGFLFAISAQLPGFIDPDPNPDDSEAHLARHCAEFREKGYPLPSALCVPSARPSDSALIEMSRQRLLEWWQLECRANPAGLSRVCRTAPQTGYEIDNFMRDLGNAKRHAGAYWQVESALLPVFIAAARGNMTAQRLMGEWTMRSPFVRVFVEGTDASVEFQMSLQYLESAALQGDIEAAKFIAGIYQIGAEAAMEKSGQRFEINWQVLDLLRRTAQQDDAEAAARLARIYLMLSAQKGSEMEREGVRWSKRAAEMGLAYAQRDLAKMYQQGVHVEENVPLAVHWFTEAAAQNDAESLYDLGALYFQGGSDESHDKIAFQYFQRAAELGDATGQMRVGQYYYEGRVVPRDLATARHWIAQSASKGYGKAKEILARMDARLPPVFP